jgi:hopanoid biosynthesis associated RND transporter like protein HpnN
MTGEQPTHQSKPLGESPEEAVAPRIAAVTERVVEFSRRHAHAVVAVCLALTLLFGWYMATHLGIDASTDHLIDPNLPWRQAEAEMDRLFPQNEGTLVIVVDGVTPELAEAAAGRLAARLAARPDMFPSVRRPDASDFFRRNGLLFLPAAEVEQLTNALAKAQPLIAALAGDPSVNGLFGALNLALEGAGSGQLDPAELDRSFTAIADSLTAAEAGRGPPLSWQRLLTDREPSKMELQRIIIVKPVLDNTKLSPGAAATAVVRSTAVELGLTQANGVRVRLTGIVALNDEEFSSIKKGLTFATVASFIVVLCWLYLALRSFKPMLAIACTLLVGLIWTLAFAPAAVGDLNLISVAFAAMFIGIAVDFGIQVCVRYRDERHKHDDLTVALRRTGRSIGGPLFLAAVTTAVGFLAFVPTAYRGVSELGIIAGAGMLIALVLNLTLLPALLMILNPGGEQERIGFAWAAPLDRFLLRNRWRVLILAGILALGGLALLPFQQFDFNPLHLKDPRAESVATLLELMHNEVTTPNTLEILTPSVDAAAALAKRLETLKEVRQALTIRSFIPDDQETKLAMIGDAGLFLLPSLSPPKTTPTADPAVTLRTLSETIERLSALSSATPAAKRLTEVLRVLAAKGDAGIAIMQRALISGLPAQLDGLRTALAAEPVSFETLPDGLKQEWLAPDGRARVEVYPRGDSNDNATLVHFVDAVRTVTPDITGTALSLKESGDTVWYAFQRAGLFALVSVVVVLALVLRRVWDVVLVIAPLLFAAVMTAETAILLGLSANFANVIALPLLFGIGVAFSIYFVVNWRAGRPDPLQSSTARAVLYSGLTTSTAFSSLSLSGHLGTAAMGWLLTIGLGHTLLASLLLLPALMGPVPDRK